MLPRKVLFFKGLPGSGKTTLAREMMSVYSGQGLTVFRANKDDIRDALRKKDTAAGLAMSSFKEKDVVERETGMVRDAMEVGINYVLIDNTHFNPVHEHRYRVIAAELGYDFEVVDLTYIPVEVCIVRDVERKNSVGRDVILKMWRENVRPKPDVIEKYEPKEGTPYAIICDLDGTLAEVTDRSPYDGHKCYGDKVRPAVAFALQGIADFTHYVIFVTGRHESARAETMRWLRDKTEYPADDGRRTMLLMRQDGDFRKDAVVKREIFDKHIRDKFNVKLVLDDRNSVVDMWRSLGLDCFQVAPGNF